MELCSTRTIGRSARRGILEDGVVVVVGVGCDCVRGRVWARCGCVNGEVVAEQRECRRDYRTCGDMDRLWGVDMRMVLLLLW